MNTVDTTQSPHHGIALEAQLDAQHRAALELVPPELLDFSSLERARMLTADLMQAAAARQPPIEGVAVEDCRVPAEGARPDLLIRIYKPAGVAMPAPALLYIHGGGFVLGEVWQFDAQCKHLASTAEVIVASIEYRRAPEYPFPNPLDDCYAALAWLHRAGAACGIDATRLGVGGSSAGAGLAAGLALLARDRAEFPVAYQLLEAPMLDHRGSTPSSQAIDHPKVWNRDSNGYGWAAYLGADHLRRNIPAYASPALATDLRRLPPAYLCVGAFDLFLDESFNYAQRLMQAGVCVEFHVYEMGYHGSPRAVPMADVSTRWRNDLSRALKRLAYDGVPINA